MIIERYERPVDWVAPEPSDPVLQELDWILDDPELFELYAHDLRAHYKRSRLGRHTISLEATYRLTFLRRRKRWTYRQAEETVRDSPAYQGWVRVYDHPVPDHTTHNDLERLVRPKTLHRMNDRVLALAQEYQLTRGYRLRVDSSVTESRSHYPTDSSLLVDGVRVLSRLLKRSQPYLSVKQRAAGWCANHLRSAKRRGRQIAQESRSEAVKTKRPRQSKAPATLKKSLSRVAAHCTDHIGPSAAGLAGGTAGPDSGGAAPGAATGRVAPTGPAGD
jgi:IS5 family transposase